MPPFNYPVNLAVSKLAPALVAGNAIVLKPPTQGAVAALHMVQCFAQAGFPKGLINAVTGKGSEIGDYMTTHPKVSWRLRKKERKKKRGDKEKLEKLNLSLAFFSLSLL